MGGMNVSEISNFREYVEEQQHICYGVELGGTPAVVGSLSRQYDFLLETIDTYQEINQPQLNPSQQIVLDYLKDKCNLYSFIAYKPFEAIIRLSMLDPEKNELRVTNIIDELTYLQQFITWDEKF